MIKPTSANYFYYLNKDLNPPSFFKNIKMILDVNYVGTQNVSGQWYISIYLGNLN